MTTPRAAAISISDPVVAIVVQGAFEKSDSIGYDAVYQYNALVKLLGADRVSIFAETFDQKRYPNTPFQPIDNFYKSASCRHSTVVYHFCDGWDRFDEYLKTHSGRKIVRWHNNTPPWFYADNPRLVARCVDGFENVLALASQPGTEFWVNSRFTARQLEALGGTADQIHIVYPASRYLNMEVETRADHALGESGAVHMLFVSRVVAHKGHRHVLALAEYLHKNLGIQVRFDIAGRIDSSAKAFNKSLTESMEASGVEVNLLGEVDEATLKSLYANADVFVCFSEHEGFGLPAFEAMRCGLPTLTWSRTAFAELLAGHPMAFPEFRLRRFSAAIMALQNKSFRSDIVALQHAISKQYSSEFVSDQILHALDPAQPEPVWSVPLSKPDTARYERLRLIIEQAEKDIAAKETFKPDFRAREEGENLVTAYDLSAFRALLSSAEQAYDGRVADSQASRQIDSVVLDAQDFFTIGGDVKPDSIEFKLDGSCAGHAVFGPYVKSPAGQYCAVFKIELSDTWPSGKKGRLEVDVLADGQDVLARSVTELGHDGTWRLPLDFIAPRHQQTIEFRVKVVTPGSGIANFYGVEVGRLNLMAQLVPKPNASLVRMKSGWLAHLTKALSRRPVAVNKLPKLAKVAFSTADKLRDAQSWNDAADRYRQGLNIAPGAVPYMVQMGNCLKEAGRYQEAEAAYGAAIATEFEDPDVWIQLADLRARTGDDEGHRLALLGALKSSTHALAAIQQLSNAGIAPSEALILLNQDQEVEIA